MTKLLISTCAYETKPGKPRGNNIVMAENCIKFSEYRQLKYATGCIDWFPNVLQFPALNGVAVGNQILENVLLAFKMSGNCHFQIKWLDNPEYKMMVGCEKQ